MSQKQVTRAITVMCVHCGERWVSAGGDETRNFWMQIEFSFLSCLPETLVITLALRNCLYLT